MCESETLELALVCVFKMSVYVTNPVLFWTANYCTTYQNALLLSKCSNVKTNTCIAKDTENKVEK